MENTLIRDLGNGLILRRSTAADAEKLASFNAKMHGEDGDDDRIGQWASDLLAKPHPTFGENDYTIVEEQSSGRIISSLNLIPQTWTYEGIRFGVGRPELVGTLPEYRRKGLVRIQMDEIHRWSASRGDLVQAITGIPNYYRRFGYEMCLDLDGSRSGFEMNLPKLPDSTPEEPYRLRAAQPADIPFLSNVYAFAARRSPISVFRNEAIWQYELNGRSDNNIHRLVWYIIECTADAEPVGYLAQPWYSWGITQPAVKYELKEGISWLDVSPTVVRWLWQTSKTICAAEGKTASAFTFALEGAHPLYEIMRDSLPRVREPYAWYLRVPNLPAFIRCIAPALETRLENSLIPGFSGELKINLYESGLRLSFESGKLTAIVTWQPDSTILGDAAFPNQAFLQVLFGHRSLDELKKSYADCYTENDRARVIINTLFPRKPSQVFGIV